MFFSLWTRWGGEEENERSALERRVGGACVCVCLLLLVLMLMLRCHEKTPKLLQQQQQL